MKLLNRTPPNRTEARRKIIQTANRFRVHQAHRRWPYVPPTVFSARHIQQAVCVVRRHGLVKPEVLEAAGFNRGGAS